MANPMTEPLEPYDPANAHELEWEYDQEQEREPRILWGRVAALAGMLVLAFFLGRMTGSTGVPAADLTKAETKVTSLEQENEDLKSELAAAQAAAEPAPQGAAAGTETAGETAEGSAAGDGAAQEVAGMDYTVKSGDTLTTIAKKFYNDPSLDDFIAEYNEIADPSALAVGQTIFLPDDTTP